MANSFNKGRVFIDATGEAVATNKRLKIVYVMFTPNSTNDSVTIAESSGGSAALILKCHENHTDFYDFSANPIVMDGIYCTAISSNAKLILYTTSAGGS